jgi:hypothetical protein
MLKGDDLLKSLGWVARAHKAREKMTRISMRKAKTRSITIYFIRFSIFIQFNYLMYRSYVLFLQSSRLKPF